MADHVTHSLLKILQGLLILPKLPITTITASVSPCKSESGFPLLFQPYLAPFSPHSLGSRLGLSILLQSATF